MRETGGIQTMATNADLREVVQFLAANPEPLWLLKHLRDEPIPIEDIADELSLPLTTVQPPLDELVKRQWVERDAEKYRITPLGAFVTMEYLTFLDTLAEIDESEQFIQELPLEAISSIHSGSHTTDPIDVYEDSSS
jgi:predicted transcriptional regulator